MQITRRMVNSDWLREFPWLQGRSYVYVALCSFTEKDTVKGAGFRWSPIFHIWWTPELDNAAKLSEWADSTCREELEERRSQNFKSLTASRAASTDREFPHPEGYDYYPFQKAGIAFCLDVFSS